MTTRMRALPLLAGAVVLVPSAAFAAAPEPNLEGVGRYAAKAQLTSVGQFSDLRPSDWAYQALTNLVERYGCVAGYANGTFLGGRPISRYEAAALLNACLERVAEATDEIKRLTTEFERELALLKGRMDALEAQAGELEAMQFSTTSKLKGEVSMMLGGVDDWFTKVGDDIRNYNRTTANYDFRFSWDTSYTGKDLLRTRFRAGNFSEDPYAGSGNVFNMDKAAPTRDTVVIDRIFYTFPVGQQFKFTLGAIARNTELLSFMPSVYKSDLLDFFVLAGATGTYNKATGAAASVSWKQKVKKGNPFWAADLIWVSQEGAAGKGYANAEVGAFTAEGAQNILAQLGIKGQNWGAAVAYRYGSENSRLRDPNAPSGSFFRNLQTGQNSNSVSLAGYWEPFESKGIPSISAGVSYTRMSEGDLPDDSSNYKTSSAWGADILSWMLGLGWKDVFLKGNSAGIAVGPPLYVTSSSAPSTLKNAGYNNPGYMFEFYYRYQVTDGISITPSIVYITKNWNDANAGDSTWGGYIQAKFNF